MPPTSVGPSHRPVSDLRLHKDGGGVCICETLLKCQWALRSPGCLVKNEDSDSVGLEWGLRTSIYTKTSDNADAAVQGLHFKSQEQRSYYYS